MGELFCRRHGLELGDRRHCRACQRTVIDGDATVLPAFAADIRNGFIQHVKRLPSNLVTDTLKRELLVVQLYEAAQKNTE